MSRIQPGQALPSATFQVKNGMTRLTSVTTESLFANKKVILFAIPGAFTATCSVDQLPRYNALAKYFKAHGIDDVICLAVNDPFVLEELQMHYHLNDITMLSDGNGTFTKALGMDIDLSGASLGLRSRRYSVYIENGTVKQLFVEPDSNPTGMTVSDADTMYHYLYPQQPKLHHITLLVRVGCGDCIMVKEMLDKKGIPYNELRHGYELTGSATYGLAASHFFPQIFVDGQHIDPTLYIENNMMKTDLSALEKVLIS